MKGYLLILAVLTWALPLPAEETNSLAPMKIGAAEASQHYDEVMVVTGKVAQVSIRPKIVFLNLDKPYPDSPFALVILPAATNQFSDVKALKGKNVEARGKIKNFHDRPEMVLESSNQLEVVGAPN